VDAVPVSVASSGSAEYLFAVSTGAFAEIVVDDGLFPAALMQPDLISVLTQKYKPKPKTRTKKTHVMIKLV
jgi:hypothetical protein